MLGMQSWERDALTKLRVTLIKDLVLEELLEHLVAHKILTDTMHDSIQSQKNNFGRNVALLNLLPKRGKRAFEVFCKVLEETGQEHLSEQLKEEAQTLRLQGTHRPLQLSVPETSSNGHCWRESCENSIDDGDGPISVPLCSVDFYLSHQKQAYRMCSRPRGLALIISNVSFSSPDLDFRSGGNVDSDSLNQLFSQLGYQVVVHNNLTAQEIVSELKEFSMRREHTKLDSCLVSLLSHGVDGAVYGADGKLVQLQDVFASLDNAHCPQLQNKPKMFFIQACRGEEADRGVDQRDGREESSSPDIEQSDAGREEYRVRLPTQSDMICAYACLRGTVSLRNTKRGSWFVQALTSVFSQHAKDTHVADMLVKVNALIKEREGYAPGTAFHRCKEMSEYSSTLCQNLYLFPGIPFITN
ncbi:caspase-2 [Bombina bombina]|uniref:caspase-2 n=1 Tax=Bombina bombina TaxID=8345 RepID=UPI00235A4D02|nr:caspase-2 [Bombina bombina]